MYENQQGVSWLQLAERVADGCGFAGDGDELPRGQGRFADETETLIETAAEQGGDLAAGPAVVPGRVLVEEHAAEVGPEDLALADDDVVRAIAVGREDDRPSLSPARNGVGVERRHQGLQGGWIV